MTCFYLRGTQVYKKELLWTLNITYWFYTTIWNGRIAYCIWKSTNLNQISKNSLCLGSFCIRITRSIWKPYSTHAQCCLGITWPSRGHSHSVENKWFWHSLVRRKIVQFCPIFFLSFAKVDLNRDSLAPLFFSLLNRW